MQAYSRAVNKSQQCKDKSSLRQWDFGVHEITATRLLAKYVSSATAAGDFSEVFIMHRKLLRQLRFLLKCTCVVAAWTKLRILGKLL